MIKKLLLTLFLIMSVLVGLAQSDRTIINLNPFTPEHEIRISYSPLMPFIWGNSNGGRSDWREPGAASLLYSYKIERWLEVGGVFTYAGAFNDYGNLRETITRLTIAPNIRFSWYNSRIVRFYSSIAFGLGVEIWKENVGQGQEKTSTLVIAPQLTPIGMSVGRKFFFFIEPFCIGIQGNLVIAGLGYRFPTKPQMIKY